MHSTGQAIRNENVVLRAFDSPRTVKENAFGIMKYPMFDKQEFSDAYRPTFLRNSRLFLMYEAHLTTLFFGFT